MNPKQEISLACDTLPQCSSPMLHTNVPELHQKQEDYVTELKLSFFSYQ